jgi:predicted RecA/RadA family phage recombinase
MREIQLSRLSVLVALGLCLTPNTAIAAAPRDGLATGNDLLAACTSPKPLEYGMCMGYISGVVDGFLVGDRTSVCIPAGVTRGQMRDVVLSGIAANPKERTQEAYAGTLLALSRHYPCRKRANQRPR